MTAQDSSNLTNTAENNIKIRERIESLNTIDQNIIGLLETKDIGQINIEKISSIITEIKKEIQLLDEETKQ